MPNLLQTGQIVNTHGIRGELKVLPWADAPDFLLEFDTFYIDGKPYAVESSRVQKTCVLLKLAGIDDVNQANLLREKVVCIDRDEIELEDGAVFIADLIGLPVLCNGQELGKIVEVLTPPSNDVYVVRGGEHEYMIPVVEEFVEEINVAGGYVTVRLIEGMQTDAD
jgi:16S rRNA processing protein RimM